MKYGIGNILKREDGLMLLLLKEVELKETTNFVCTSVSSDPYMTTQGFFTILETDKNLYYHVPAVGLLTKEMVNQLQLIDQLTDSKAISSLLNDQNLVQQLAVILNKNY